MLCIEESEREREVNIMAALKGSTLRLIFLLGLITGLILMLMYFFINDSDREIANKLYGLYENNNIVRSFQKQKTKRAGIHIRHRLVNDFGIIIADEQPDINEINAVNEKYYENKKHRNDSLTRVHKQEFLSKKITPFIIEHDPTIDQNAVPLSYKYYANNNIRLPECTGESPTQKIAFLSLHQTGDQIISNILYRYGDLNSLYFALPKSPVFEYYWPLRFNPSHVDKSLLNKAKANFVINAARNNEASLRGLLSSRSVYVTMLRDPVDHYRNIYEYAGMRRLMARVTPNNTDDENFEQFFERPVENIDRILNTTKTFEPAFHLLKNPQLFDLGFEVDDYRSSSDLQHVLRKLDQQLTLVLLYEYIDESLVLLQRILCWQLLDMVYVRRQLQKENNQGKNVTPKTKKQIEVWNHEDYMLYQYFNKTLWTRIRQQNDPLFWNDVTKLRKMSDDMEEECFEPKNDTSTSVLTIRNNVTEELRSTCQRLALQEKDYVTLLKIKQRQRIKEEYDVMIKEHYVTNGTSGKFLYALKADVNNTENIENLLNDEHVGNDDITDNNGNKEEDESQATILKL